MELQLSAVFPAAFPMIRYLYSSTHPVFINLMHGWEIQQTGTDVNTAKFQSLEALKMQTATTNKCLLFFKAAKCLLIQDKGLGFLPEMKGDEVYWHPDLHLQALEE